MDIRYTCHQYHSVFLRELRFTENLMMWMRKEKEIFVGYHLCQRCLICLSVPSDVSFVCQLHQMFLLIVSQLHQMFLTELFKQDKRFSRKWSLEYLNRYKSIHCLLRTWNLKSRNVIKRNNNMSALILKNTKNETIKIIWNNSCKLSAENIFHVKQTKVVFSFG